MHTLVYILGAGHSGSTLLDMLLNAHSDTGGLGEISAIHRYLGQREGSPLGLSSDEWAAPALIRASGNSG